MDEWKVKDFEAYLEANISNAITYFKNSALEFRHEKNKARGKKAKKDKAVQLEADAIYQKFIAQTFESIAMNAKSRYGHAIIKFMQEYDVLESLENTLYEIEFE